MACDEHESDDPLHGLMRNSRHGGHRSGALALPSLRRLDQPACKRAFGPSRFAGVRPEVCPSDDTVCYGKIYGLLRAAICQIKIDPGKSAMMIPTC